ncbi:hypothetical protein [Arthrobacter sp.]|uniref:hypothetical protein n=1 Tax=Arthrobacter sp. TaxID=1667 RepID=UPI003A938869
MKVALFVASTIGCVLLVLFGTLAAGQLAGGSPTSAALLTGLGLFVVCGGAIWHGFLRHSSNAPAVANDLSELSWTPEARAITSRTMRKVGLVVAAALLASLCGFGSTHAGLPLSEALASLSFYLQGVFLAGTFATVIATYPLGTALREASGADASRHRVISKVVLRGKDLPLDADEELGAARMAAVAPVVLPLLNFSFGYLFATLLTQYARFVAEHPADPFITVLFAVLVLTIVVGIPLLARQIRRARRYASDHAALLVG